jgi:hypothetical protein
MKMTPPTLDSYRYPLRHADLEILPMDPEPTVSNFKFQGIHVAGRRTALALAIGRENASVTWAYKLRLIGMPIDRAAKVRTDRSEHGDSLSARFLPANPNGMPRSSFLPTVFLDHLQRDEAPLADWKIGK